MVLKILSGNEILTSIKGHNSVANLPLYLSNLDIIYVNVYTKFDYILSIGSQDIEQKRNSYINQGPLLCCKFAKFDNFQSQPRYYLCKFMCIQNLVKFCPLVLKILSGNEILRSIKGRNSVANLRNLTLYNHNLDLINVNVYTKFGKILSFHSQDIERKRK